MVLTSAQLGARPEQKDGVHPALCNALMRHQSHQSHHALSPRYSTFFSCNKQHQGRAVR